MAFGSSRKKSSSIKGLYPVIYLRTILITNFFIDLITLFMVHFLYLFIFLYKNIHEFARFLITFKKGEILISLQVVV